MEKLNAVQIANFVYWLLEYHNARGLRVGSTSVDAFKGQHPKEKMDYICKLQREFLKKYPDGLLVGWSDEANPNL